MTARANVRSARAHRLHCHPLATQPPCDPGSENPGSHPADPGAPPVVASPSSGHGPPAHRNQIERINFDMKSSTKPLQTELFCGLNLPGLKPLLSYWRIALKLGLQYLRPALHLLLPRILVF